ncbi:hypothetical protein FNV43_RR15149 [Rhamnella rubrinervis]|uniref:Uncharacterized protein n=1 Tax=Rhamnella rubrinervis TaxID=2594499 RepID=A0A8K0GWY9_9ROSA|nr:hypothetical protein FNV43_RR15149 [Rhamnella rubrinervis]
MDGDDNDKVGVVLEKAPIVELEKNSIKSEKTQGEMISMVEAAQSQSQPLAAVVSNNNNMNAAPLSPTFISRRIDQGLKEIMEGLRDDLKSIKENMDEEHFLHMIVMDEVLLEKDILLKEQDDSLERKERVIRLLIKELNDLYEESELNDLYEESDTAKKRSFGDISTTSNTSPERRTRSRVHYQDTQNEEVEGILNKTQDTEYEEEEEGEVNTTKCEEDEGEENATKYEED